MKINITRKTVFLLSLTIAVVVGLVLRFLTPKVQPAPAINTPSFLSTIPHPVAVNSTSAAITPPKQLAVVSATRVSPQFFTSSMETSLGLKQQQLVQNSYISDDRQTTLSGTADPNVLHYLDTTNVPIQGSVVSENQAREFVSSFLQKIQFPLQTINVTNPTITFSNGADEGDGT